MDNVTELRRTAPPNFAEMDMPPHSAALDWITPNAEERIVYMARVSSDPSWETRPDVDLLRYCIRKSHWSIFDMANLCAGIYTSRTIARQIIRHSSLKPQEFSQRYANVKLAGQPIFSEARIQHPSNRQQSIVTNDADLEEWWQDTQLEVWDLCLARYNEAILRGMAKELARDLLPEGLTPSRTFFNGRIRDWLHFCRVRSVTEGAQLEAAFVADSVRSILRTHTPTIYEAFFVEGNS